MKSILLIVSLFLISYITHAQAPTNGLVAYYPFNGNAQDAVGTNHGTVNGATLTNDRKGLAISAYNTTNGEITIPSNTVIGNANSNITISGWVKPELLWNGDNRAAILGKGGVDLQTGYELMVRGNHLVEFAIKNSYVVSQNIIPINEWTHIVGKFDNSTHEISLYFNGIKQSLSLINTQPPFSILTNSYSAIIGQRNTGNNFANRFLGSLDDIRLYNRALTDTEILQLYQAEAPPIDITTGLVAHYKMDGNAQDASGNSNHGTQQGGVTFGNDRFGNTGKAASFDGVNDYFQATSSQTLTTTTTSFWFKPSNLNIQTPICLGVDDGIGGSPTLNGISLFVPSNIVKIFSSDQQQIPTGYSFPSANQWYFVTIQQNAGLYKLFVNSTLVFTGNGAIPRPATQIRIGSATNIRFFNGLMDDIRIYNRALSDAEVLALYASEYSGVTLTNAMRFGGGQTVLNVGTAYNLSASIKNNGSSSWVGDVYLRVKNGTPTLISSNNVISAGGTYNIASTFTPQTAQIGTGATMELLTKQGTNDFVRVATVNGTVNPAVVNIEAASAVPVVRVPFIRLNQSEVNLGGTVQIVGGNFEPNTNVTIGSSPSIAGATYPNVTVALDGSINTTFIVPTTFTERYLTIIGRNVKSDNPGALVLVNQPQEVATLSITKPYKANETINITPEGNVPIEFSDKLLKGSAYPQSGASRSYRYEIGYQYGGGTVYFPLRQLPVETDLLNKEIRKTVLVPMTGFSTITTSGGWVLKFIIKDLYNNQRVAESPLVNINVVQNISKISMKWDKSFSPMPSQDPIGIAADGVARMYLVLEKNSPTGSPIQSVSVVLANAESNSDPTNFNNGTWLGRVKYANQQNNTQYSEEANGITTLTAQNLTTNADGKYWFWYVAPDDFTKDGAGYINDSEREVAAKFTVTYADGTMELVTKDIQIVRPPLMLVHGLNGSAESWEKFSLKNTGLFKHWRASTMLPDAIYTVNALGLVNKMPTAILFDDTFQGVLTKMREKDGFQAK